jgi:hypothetical protein
MERRTPEGPKRERRQSWITSGAVCSGGSLQVMRDWRVPPSESELSLKGEGVMNQEGYAM